MNGPSGAATVRVVVAEDSTTARQLLVSLCERDPHIQVVGEAADGTQAVQLTVRLRPCLVLMDIYMPVLDGIEATKQIMRTQPTPIIMVTAGTHPQDVEAGLSAVRFGALTVLPKPSSPGTPEFDTAAQRLITMIKALADVKVIRHRGVGPRPSGAVDGVRLVAVAASTGGPLALSGFLQHLPHDFPAPVVVVQHIVEGFLPGLVAWLRTEVPFHVTQAVHGQRLEAGTVYLAPDGHHLEVDGALRARLTGTDPVQGFRPSASVLFRSLARVLGPAATGVVMTGMGQDGLEGLRELRAAGGRVLAQDQESCVVYGMPGAVTKAGLAHLVGPVEQLAADVAATRRRTP